MAVTEELVIKLSIDSKGTITGLKEVQGSLDGFKKSARDAEKAGDSFSKIGVSVVVLNQALEIAQKAMRAFAGPIQAATKAFIEHDKVERKLATTLGLVGQYSDQTMNSFKEFASELENTSMVSGESALGLIQIAKAMRLSDSQAKTLVKAASELSAATGKDLDSSFHKLLKTTKGVSGELGDLIPEVNALTVQQLKAGGAFTVVAKIFDGFAKGEVGTLSGAINQSEKAFNSLTEEVGRSFVNLVNLPKLLTESKKAFDEMKTVVKLVSVELVVIRDALTNVDWKEIGNSILYVAAAFAAFKLAAFSIEISLAIKAIGGLSTAIAAMGGLTGILASVKAFFAGSAFVVAAKAIAIAAAKFIAIGLAIVGVAAAVDILVRNFERLPEILELIGKTGATIFARIVRGVNSLAIGVLSGFETILEPLAKVSETAESALKLVRSGMIGLSNEVDETNVKIDSFDKKIIEIGKSLDLGFAGQAVKLFKDLMKDSAAAVGEVGDKIKNIPQVFQSMAMEAEKFLGMFRNLNMENISLAMEVSRQKDDQIAQINDALTMEMLKLNALQEEINLNVELADFQRAALNEQIELNRKLKKEKAEKDKGDVIRSQGGPNMFDGFSKAVDAFKSSQMQFSGSVGGGFAGGISAFAGGVGMMMGAAEGIVDTIQKFIDFIPNMLQKITKVFDSLRELPNQITEKARSMFKAVERFISEFIPNLFKGMLDLLDDFFTSAFEGIPNAFQKLIESLPEVFEKFQQRIPGLVKKFVQGILTSGPRMITTLLTGFVRDSPKLAKSFLKIMPLIVKEFVGGVVAAMKETANEIARAFGFQNIFKQAGKEIEKSADKLGKKIVKDSSQLFKILDMEAERRTGQGITPEIDPRKIGRNIMRWLMDALNKAIDFFKMLGQKIWEGLIEPIANWFGDRGTEIWEGFIKPLANWFGDRGTEIWESMVAAFTKVATWFGERGTEIWNGLISPVLNWFGDRGTEIWEGFIKPVGNWFGDRGTEIWTGFITPVASWFGDRGTEVWNGFIKPIGNWFGDVGTKMWSGFVSGMNSFRDAIGGVLTSVGDTFAKSLEGIPGKLQSAFDKLNPGNLMEKVFKIDYKGMGDLENKVLKLDVPWSKFAFGTPKVPGISKVIGDSPLNDIVPTLLSPGEAVIPKSLMNNPDINSLINSILSGKVTNLSDMKDLILGPLNEGMVSLFQNPAALYKGGIVGDFKTGEFTSSRESSDRISSGFANAMGGGRSGSGSQTINVEQDVNVSINGVRPQDMDEGFIRQRLMPAIKKELKRASFAGEQFISPRGLVQT
jgi:hypothetical protein